MKMSKTIKFYGPDDPYFQFSNFYIASVKINGFIYTSSEHAYQAAKFLGDDATKKSQIYAGIIGSEKSAAKAKILAKQKKVGGYKWKTDLNPIIEKYSDVKLRSDWENVKDDVMRYVVYKKFKQHPNLSEFLLDTDNSKFEENSIDSYWGIGADGNGKNMLGVILMETRDILRSQK